MNNSCTEYFKKNILEYVIELKKSGEEITNSLIKIPYKCSLSSQRNRSKDRFLMNNYDYPQILNDINTDDNFPYSIDETNECSGGNPLRSGTCISTYSFIIRGTKKDDT